MTEYKRYTAKPPRTCAPLWLRVLKVLVLALFVGTAFTGGVAMSWLQRTAAQVAHNNPVEVKSAAKQLDPALPSHPVNILVIGSDRRVGQPDIGARSDTLIVVRLDPQTKTISMLSVPRDLLVTIPGYGQNKINAAYSFGGAKLAVETVRQVLGIPINHFIDVGFTGFKDVVDRLGGAYLMIDTRYYNKTATDDWASIDIEPGYQLLSGAQTLSFVRFRHDQNGDFTRIVRQQMFLREMKRELAASANLADFPRLLSVATIMSRFVVSDIDSLSKLYSLVSLVTQVDATHIYQTHVDGSTPTINGVDYVTATSTQIRSAVKKLLHPVGASTKSHSKASATGESTTASSSTATGDAATLEKTRADLTQWRALRSEAGLALFMPTVWSASLGYDQFRAYHVTVGSHHVRAAVVVGTTPEGGYWDIQALHWSDPPILASPDAVKTIGGRSYSLYYDDAHLHLVAWRRRGTVYWLSNTLDDELSNSLMLTLATSCSLVRG